MPDRASATAEPRMQAVEQPLNSGAVSLSLRRKVLGQPRASGYAGLMRGCQLRLPHFTSITGSLLGAVSVPPSRIIASESTLGMSALCISVTVTRLLSSPQRKAVTSEGPRH